MDVRETYKETLQSIKVIISQESDSDLKNDLLTKLNFIISSSKSEKVRMEKLREFSCEFMDSLSNDSDTEKFFVSLFYFVNRH